MICLLQIVDNYCIRGTITNYTFVYIVNCSPFLLSNKSLYSFCITHYCNDIHHLMVYVCAVRNHVYYRNIRDHNTQVTTNIRSGNDKQYRLAETQIKPYFYQISLKCIKKLIGYVEKINEGDTSSTIDFSV